jgi:hypothetical protein
VYGCEPYIQFSTEELFCIVNGRLEAKAIYHQHSWWVLKGSCIPATPFLLYTKNARTFLEFTAGVHHGRKGA